MTTADTNNNAVGAKHTPGPWEASPIVDDPVHGKGWAVLAVSPMRGRIDSAITGMSEANARLIAAAPDLLDALKGVWALIDSGQLCRNTSDDGNPDWAIRQIPLVTALKAAGDAIVKAEGWGL